MEAERSDATRLDDELPGLPGGWRIPFLLGLITFVLGVIIAFRPVQTLIAIAVLFGVVMIVTGIYHIVRAFDGREHERVWRGITGVLFILAGLLLFRHLDLSVALIGLFVGFVWVFQGVSSLAEAVSRRHEGARTGWAVFFGIISLIAGIVVIAAPIASIAALTIFLGIWFVVMGLMEMLGSLIARHTLRKQAKRGGGVTVPGQRATTATVDQNVAGQTATAGDATRDSRHG